MFEQRFGSCINGGAGSAEGEPWIWSGSLYTSSPYSASETAGDHRVEQPRALDPSELDARRI